jgi:hypothetical protein
MPLAIAGGSMPRNLKRVCFLMLGVSCATLFQSTSRGIEPASAESTAPAGASAQAADLSTPAKAAKAFAVAMCADDPSAIRAVTTNGTDADYLTLQSWAAYTRSAGKLHGAMAAKFGADAGAAIMGGGLAGFEDESTLDVKIDADSATVSAGQGRQRLMLIRTDGKWRIDIARLPNKDQLSTGAADMRAIGKVMDRIAGEIADGRYDSADAAGEALGHAMEPVLQPQASGNDLARQAPSTRSAVDLRPKSPVTGYDPAKVDAQRQLYQWSGIPMAVELVLKLTGREPADYDALQQEWKNKRDGNFINFDGKTVSGLTFHHQFDDPRGNEFPTGKLFKTINSELDHGRYVLISMHNGSGWGIWVIVGRTASGDYHAVSKSMSGQTVTATNVKARVREMKGTDILTYITGD